MNSDRSIPKLLTALAAVILISVTACAGVSVRVASPGVHYRTFDPAKPPAEMPPLASREGAVTACSFGFSAEPHYDVITRERGADGTWTATLAVSGVSVYVRLNVIIWTPKGVSAKLKAHEEGHRTLDEMMYKKLSEPAARAAGAEMDGRQFTGQGATAAKAEADALRTMFKQAGHDYLAQSSDLNDQVNAAYDTLTRHGTAAISEADAIKQVIEQFEHDHPSDAATK